ncbi:hypothetical protein VP1G_06217 [Cytospora mali]|uniref:Uncharacterized protein n=1 Tax=Cytospora mali TaxID=578113 RepID=A0A194V4N2_CYTMA|nr:hypothetical protein VP1G_06217 [Valsa mali var. pyri (nom. inval.)]
MQLLGPLLGQLFSFLDNMASSSPQKTANLAPTTPPSSQSAQVERTENDGLTTAPNLDNLVTPISPPENERPRKRRRIMNRITRPEPGSLYDIMHEKQGESLFTIPICWTDQHPKALGVQWTHRDTIRKPVPDFNSMSSKYPPRPTRIATELSRDLTTILAPGDPSPLSCASIKNVMSALFPATLSKARTGMDLELRFGDRVLKRAVRVPVLWKQYDRGSRSFDSASTRIASSYGRVPSSSRETVGTQATEWSRNSFQSTPTQPTLAFVNRNSLRMMRRTLYRVLPGPINGDHRNTPVANLQRLRSKRLIPQNADHDPYLVAIMIAIAQWHCYPSSRSTSRSSSQRSSQGSQPGAEAWPPQPDFRDIPVKIITQNSATAEFVIHSAVVTAAFVKRFACPFKAPDADDPLKGGLNIQVTKVQVWPVLGLKERLAKALGPELAGELESSHIADGDIETWETEQERDFRMGNLKRKRGVIYDSFNKSLEITDDEVESPSPGKGLGLTVASPPLSPRTPKRRRTQSNTQLEVC